jgi:hypothetical protein
MTWAGLQSGVERGGQLDQRQRVASRLGRHPAAGGRRQARMSCVEQVPGGLLTECFQVQLG